MAIQDDRKIIEELGSSLTIKVPYSADLNYPLEKAIELAKENLPKTSRIISGLRKVKTAIELEALLKDTDSTLIVEKNFAEDFQKYLNIEAAVSEDVEKDMDKFCPLPLPNFTKEEIDQIVNSGVCEVHLEPEDPNINLDDLTNQLSSDQPMEQKNKLEECLAEIDGITANIKHLIEEEEKAGDIQFQLEEAEWFYIITAEYYKERERVVKEYLGIYEPLLLEKRRLETELESAPQKLYHFRTGIGSGSFYDKIDDAVPNELGHTLIDSEKHPIRVQLEKDLEFQKNKIADEKVKTAQFDNSISENDLRVQLNDLFGSNSIGWTISNKVRNFADENRISVHVPSVNNSSNANINFSIGFSLWIDSVLFQQYRNGSIKLDETLFRNTTIKSGDFRKNIVDMFAPSRRIGFAPRNTSVEVHGVLYDRLYNIMGNPNVFFTNAERGSTAQSPPTVINQTIFEEFWTNFEPKWKARRDLIVDTVIKPAHEDILKHLRGLAKIESLWQLSYGKVFEDLLDEDDADRLRTVVEGVENDIKNLRGNFLANKNALEIIDIYRKRIKEEIEVQTEKYNNVPCAKNPGSPPINVPAAGNDPLGKATYKKGNNPQLPDPTKFCYWKEFAKLATLVNISPIPSNKPVPVNLFRYWPVGLIIPTAAGPYNIPLPIIWKALATIPTPMGIFVIFLGQCGILPCPFVLWISTDGESKFIATLKGKKDIVSVTGQSSSKLPPVKLTMGTLKLTMKSINEDKDGNSLKNSIADFTDIDNPDSPANAIKDVFDRVMKKVSKLENPDFSKIAKMRDREVKREKAKKNGLSIPTDFSLEEKINAIEESTKGLLAKLKFDDICFPKDKEKLNPKQGLVGKVIETLDKAKDLKLPGLTLPAVDQIDLKEKLFKQLESDPSTGEKLNTTGLSGEDKNKKIQDFKEKIKNITGKATENLKKPEVLGIVAAVSAGVTVNFFKPFVCSPSGDGAKLPPIPGAVLGGVATLALSIPTAIDLLSEGELNGKSIKDILISTTDRIIPSLKVPNPTNLTMKDFAINTSLKLATFSKPSIPNPGPIVKQICIPGGLIKLALEAAIFAAISAGVVGKIMLGGSTGMINPDGSISNLGTSLSREEIIRIIEEACCEDCAENHKPIGAKPGVVSSNRPTSPNPANSTSTSGINLSTIPKELKMRDLNPSDIRQLLTNLIEGSLKELEKKLSPILQSISILSAFPELNFFKLPVFELNKGMTLIFEKKKVEVAFDQLEKLSAIPFMAVATGGEASRLLHPVGNTDDLPPWERLTLSNILFVVYLDQFCSTARSGGGFKDATNFPAPG